METRMNYTNIPLTDKRDGRNDYVEPMDIRELTPTYNCCVQGGGTEEL